MLAVHFGAGNIGRGFIGSLLSNSGYEVCFVDVNAEIVDLLNEKKQYRVVLADETNEEITVQNVRAVNSISDAEQVIDEIAKADLVTTAVGPHILSKVSSLLTKGLRKRMEMGNGPLNIIACENMIGGSEHLKEKVYENLTLEEQKSFEHVFAFPNAAVDRIVPIQENENKIMVSVEPFYEWVVDRTQIIGEVPAIEGVTYVDDLTPFLERKLFTVNTGHATAAYLGYQAGMKTIYEALGNKDVLEALKQALNESGDLLVKKYQFNPDDHSKYVKKIIERFQNPYINDDIPRVARNPIRKLGPNDRLISPAKQYYEYVGEEPVYLAKTIAAALKYDFPQDEEAIKLQSKINDIGYEKTLQEVSGLEKSHPLVEHILKNI